MYILIGLHILSYLIVHILHIISYLKIDKDTYISYIYNSENIID